MTSRAYGLASEDTLADLNSKASDLDKCFAAGQVRTAGGKLQVNASGTGYFQLSNPSGSGVTMTLREFTLAADQASDVAFRFDTTLASPTTWAPFNPNRAFEAVPTRGLARSSTATPTVAGTTLSPIYRLPQNIPIIQAFTIVLLPGQSVTATLNVGLTATAFYAAGTWTEV